MAYLRRFVLMQSHKDQSTLPRLTALLQPVGIAISKREIQRQLTDDQDDFLAENRDVLRAGHTDFVSNDAAFECTRSRTLSETLIGLLAEQMQTPFADQAAWSAHLERLGFNALTTAPDSAQIAAEMALREASPTAGIANIKTRTKVHTMTTPPINNTWRQNSADHPPSPAL